VKLNYRIQIRPASTAFFKYIYSHLSDVPVFLSSCQWILNKLPNTQSVALEAIMPGVDFTPIFLPLSHDTTLTIQLKST